MLSDRDILDEFKQRIAGHFSDSSSQLGDMQPQVARRGCDPLRRSLRPRLQRSTIGGWLGSGAWRGSLRVEGRRGVDAGVATAR